MCRRYTRGATKKRWRQFSDRRRTGATLGLSGWSNVRSNGPRQKCQRTSVWARSAGCARRKREDERVSRCRRDGRIVDGPARAVKIPSVPLSCHVMVVLCAHATARRTRTQESIVPKSRKRRKAPWRPRRDPRPRPKTDELLGPGAESAQAGSPDSGGSQAGPESGRAAGESPGTFDHWIRSSARWRYSKAEFCRVVGISVQTLRHLQTGVTEGDEDTWGRLVKGTGLGEEEIRRMLVVDRAIYAARRKR